MQHKNSRSAFTLIELLLSLALIVVATALVGSLMQMFSRNFATRGDDIRREQLARALLSKIADDVRAVILPQEYDSSVLEQLLGASGGSSAADAQAATDSTSSLAGSTSPTDSSSTTAPASGGELSTTVTTSLPPGIYGDQYSLIVDVSRIPRPDEYNMQTASMSDPFIADVPGDMKTVTYFIQSPTNMGVDDTLAQFETTNGSSSGQASGLVRRQLDRAVTAYAEEMGNTQRLQRTGDLLAPEVVALEFAYFDGVDWLTEWDSSTQSLPWLVEITLAMQTATAGETTPFTPGVSISLLPHADRQAYGIEVYQLVVAIPGAQLHAVDAATAEQAAGMESMGL
ncbi:MAG: prepilin-type N-terminal cleavage/methylation domain-containing protein [Pirellulaceae bacterium]|jgi:type II secretory pathway pseudopilin PulG